MNPMPAGPPPRSDGGYLRLRLLWAALVIASFSYFFLARSLPAPPDGPFPPPWLLTACLLTTALSVPLREQLLIRAHRSGTEVFIQAAHIVPMVLCEAVALTGFILRLVNGTSFYWLFIGMGAGGLMFHFPRREK
jgi:hypothetical protein